MTLPPVYGGEILHVDLESGESRIEGIDEADARRFLGGNGFAAKLIHEHVPPDADAFDAENVVVFAVGPMNLTPFQSTSRGVVGFVSPMTNGFFDSTFGGSFPRAQKSLGFDAVALHGRAPELSYVRLSEDGAEVVPAPDLEGRETYETCEAVREAEGQGFDTHVIAAGPAGENRVRYACLLHQSQDREGVAGRGGSGAVLGSKNVKAVAIREGEFEPEPADESGLRNLAIGQMGELMEGTEMLQEYGTPGLVNPVNEMGKLGRHNNASELVAEADAEAISGERLEAEYVTEDTTCANCAVKCGKHVSVESAGITQAKIPEFESLFATSPMTESYDVERVIEANDLCDRFGMDTISWGVTVAFAREAHERGLLDADEPGLEFGDSEGLVELAELTARREGIGDRLAEGSARLADSLSADADDPTKYVHGVKGLELAAHSPRGLKGMSIGYATSTRGGSHHDTRPTRQYAGEYDETTEGTPEFAARSQHFTALGDSLTQCRFVSEGGWGKAVNDRYRDAINAATGWDLTTEEVEAVGERIYNVERLINVERGIASRETDTLPYRVQHEPIPEGPSAGMYCPPEELEAMLGEYYEFRGWDENGEPTAETLERLDLGDLADA